MYYIYVFKKESVLNLEQNKHICKIVMERYVSMFKQNVPPEHNFIPWRTLIFIFTFNFSPSFVKYTDNRNCDMNDISEHIKT